MSPSDDHIDDGTLSLLALNEDAADAATLAHLRTCSVCQASLAELENVVGVARHPEVALGLETPPARVWDGVVAELGDDTGEMAPRQLRQTARDVTAARRPWWHRPTAWVVAASFALGVFGTLAIDRLVADRGDVGGDVVAQAELAALPGWSQTGSASVHEVDGRQVLTVELPGGVPDGYREVWLIDTGVERLVSLGILVGVEGEFDLPAGVDLAEFPIVDVSLEPFDGDPAHSGDSIVRGQLAEAEPLDAAGPTVIAGPPWG